MVANNRLLGLQQLVPSQMKNDSGTVHRTHHHRRHSSGRIDDGDYDDKEYDARWRKRPSLFRMALEEILNLSSDALTGPIDGGDNNDGSITSSFMLDNNNNINNNSSSADVANSGQQSLATDWRGMLAVAILAFITLATIVGNILVILSVFTYKPLRMVQNFFIVSLAAADLTVALLVLPLNMAYLILDGKWIFGIYVCEMWLTCDVLCCTASM